MSEATWEVVEITTGVGRVPKWQVRGPGFSATFRDEGVARLIASAPDLLAACEALFAAEHYDHFAVRMSDSEMDAIETMKAAIAKARGTP